MAGLVLFDIDGTLIDSGGAGAISLDMAFYDIFSIKEGFSGISMAGKTDIQIIKEALQAHGLPHDNGVLPLVESYYLKHLSSEINNNRKHIKPGVKDILDWLSDRNDCWSGLLTGNIEKGAHIKLEAFGLNEYFSVGAFGSDDEDRNRLLPIAVEKLSKLMDVSVSFSDCIVVGDTPRDVACAKPYGAIAVAVSTGPYSYESLAETDADVVVRDLTDAQEFLCELGYNSES